MKNQKSKIKKVLIISLFCFLLIGTMVMAENFQDDIILEKGLPKITEPQKVILMFPMPEAKDWLEGQLIPAIESLNPNLKVDLQILDTASMIQAINIKLVGGSPPTAAAPGGFYSIQDWVKAGALLDLTEYWEKYNLKKLIPEGIQAATRFNGKYYGVSPYCEQNNILYWNKKVLKEAGVKEPPYKDWNEFFAIAEEFTKKTGKPFWAEGLNPSWFALERIVGLAAERYGPSLVERVANGNATDIDFKNMLEFQKKLIKYSNKDYVSTDSIQGQQQIVARGDAAFCWQGNWGKITLDKAGLVLHKDYDFGQLPGYNIFYASLSGLVAFKGSGQETAGMATILSFMTKECQVIFCKNKGSLPARTDIELDPNIFPEIVLYGAKIMKEGTTIPRVKYILSSVVTADYAGPVTGYLSGAMTLDKAVNDLLQAQEKHQKEFIIKWKF